MHVVPPVQKGVRVSLLGSFFLLLLRTRSVRKEGYDLTAKKVAAEVVWEVLHAEAAVRKKAFELVPKGDQLTPRRYGVRAVRTAHSSECYQC